MAEAAKNSIEGRAQPYLERIENLMDEIESAKGEYMAECKSRREDIREIYKEAKDNGVQVKALRGLVRYRELERKQAELAEGFDIDEAAAYDHLVEALGDLGRAAQKRAGYGPKSGDDEKRDLRPRNLIENEKSRADEDALGKVGRGPATH